MFYIDLGNLKWST